MRVCPLGGWGYRAPGAMAAPNGYVPIQCMRVCLREVLGGVDTSRLWILI